MITIIEFPNYSLRVRVLKPDAAVEAADTYAVADFWRDFTDAGRKVRAPIRSMSSRDAGVAHNLLKKYQPPLLRELARIFWQKYSQPVFDKPELSAVLLFSARIPDILREM